MDASSITNPSTWEAIERSESYLVCCMFEEAASLACSIIKQLCDDQNARDELLERNENEWDVMLESAGMVLVQSLKGLGRTSEIINELRLLFCSVAAVPVQVVLTGTCFQISENSLSDVQEFLEEFLSTWRFVDEGYYICAQGGITHMDTSGNMFSLEVDKYLEVVELHVITLLATVKKDTDLAVSWVEKATLPVERKQELLRRLHSMGSCKVTSSTQASLQVDEYRKDSASVKEEKVYNGSLEHLEARYHVNTENSAKDSFLKLSGQGGQRFWWFRTFILKFGSNRWVISNGNILLGCLALLIYYIMRRKQVNIKSFLKKHALTMRKALVDLWQLAFSYQVNPLAAVQSLPAAPHGGR